MATYNSEMNRRLYAAAGRLSDAERRRDRGAFFRSIHETFSHLLWADRMWMSRLADWEAPPRTSVDGAGLFTDFDVMSALRTDDDKRIEAWAQRIDDAWLTQMQRWYSGVAKREVTMARTMLLMHVFNHQTHHRGQVHAMLTAAGETTGATDLWIVVPTD